jgi:HEPN domain-containing protein
MPPPDPCQMMLRKAAQDAALAAKLASDASVSNEHLGFFCQQAVEKAIKSVLSHRNVAYRRTHDLSELLELTVTHGVDFPDELSPSVMLTPFAVAFRYDELPPSGAGGVADAFDRAGAVRLASIAVQWAGDAVGEK